MEGDEEDEELEYVGVYTDKHQLGMRRTYDTENMVLYRQGPRSFTLGEVAEETTATTAQVVPYLPERKGTRRATVESTRKCTTLKTEQVVVYFWKRTTAEGGAEGYSIGEAEETERGEEGSDQTTAERQVRVFINLDKTKTNQYAEYEDFDPADQQHTRKETNDQVVRDTITAENVLMAIAKHRRGKKAHGWRQTIKLRSKEARRVTDEAIADDRAAHREDTKRQEQEKMESEDETSGAQSGIEGGGKKGQREAHTRPAIARMEPPQTAAAAAAVAEGRVRAVTTMVAVVTAAAATAATAERQRRWRHRRWQRWGQRWRQRGQRRWQRWWQR
jgi:hypothetical protein